jgi:hypothetical protein
VSVAPPVTVIRRLRWILFAAVPAALLATSSAALVPDTSRFFGRLILPSTVYLVTLVIAFARPPAGAALSPRGVEFFRTFHRGLRFLVLAVPVAVVVSLPPEELAVVPWLVAALGFLLIPYRWLLVLQPLAVLFCAACLALAGAAPDEWPVVCDLALLIAHLLALYVSASVIHGELARDRPAARRLTEYYLWFALGTVLARFLLGPAAAFSVPATLAAYTLALVLAAALIWPHYLARRRKG